MRRGVGIGHFALVRLGISVFVFFWGLSVIFSIQLIYTTGSYLQDVTSDDSAGLGCWTYTIPPFTIAMIYKYY